jgi:hypothetical protein
VSAVLRFCHAHGVKVVARGAGTSLAGGAIPQEDAIVLGVAKMNRVLDVNTGEGWVRLVTDGEGFRIPPGGLQPADRTVLLLGDSFMAAIQVEYEPLRPVRRGDVE